MMIGSLAPGGPGVIMGNEMPLSTVQRITIVLEGLLSLGALWGGASLVARPDGSLMHLPLAQLAHAPFSDYLVPGFLLLAVNGLFPLVVIFLVLRRQAWSPRLTVLSGVLLVGWIAVQIAMMRLFFPPLHLPYLVLGVTLASLGVVEQSRRANPDMHGIRGPVVGSIVGLFMFVVLPLLAWGANDLRTFLAEPARLVYLGVAALASVSVAILVPPPTRSRGDEQKLVRRQRLAVLVLQVLGLAIILVAPYGDRRGIAVVPVPAIRVLGLALFLLGQLTMAWAQLALGHQFSLEVTVQKDHRLVADGLYRYLRHPRYLGILLFTLGLALVFRSVIGLALVGIETLVLLWRISDEEALLRREFGPDWDAYAKRSWRMVPFLY